jgi:hypothetical protein
MGNVSFSDRFELLELLHEGDVQTFRARERATGRDVEAHLSASSDRLAKFESMREPGKILVMDRGSHDGKFYFVTAPLGLDSVGAWRIKPQGEPQEKAAPGDFTRMFELRQAPNPVATPAAKPVHAPAASQPGEFTRVFKKPAAAPAATPIGSSAPGQPGEFTRMFQQPVPAPAVRASQPAASANAPASRVAVGLIVTAIMIVGAIAVFVLVRTLY